MTSNVKRYKMFVGKELGAEFVSFDKLLQESDHVFIACSLTDETRGMFNKVAFEKMKSTSVLVNIARGRMLFKFIKKVY